MKNVNKNIWKSPRNWFRKFQGVLSGFSIQNFDKSSNNLFRPNLDFVIYNTICYNHILSLDAINDCIHTSRSVNVFKQLGHLKLARLVASLSSVSSLFRIMSNLYLTTFTKVWNILRVRSDVADAFKVHYNTRCSLHWNGYNYVFPVFEMWRELCPATQLLPM